MLLRLISSVERVSASISGIVILVMMILTTIDVFLRYVFNSPLDWNFELQSLLLVGVAYLGLSYVQSKRGHICMDVLSSRLSKTTQSGLQLINDAIFLFLSVVITWQMGQQAWIALVTGDFVWGVVKFPLWPAKWIITLGTGLISLRLISDIINNPLWRKQSKDRQNRSFFGLTVIALIFVLTLSGVIIARNLAMESQIIGWVAIALFFILLIIGTPVAPTMMISGICGFWLLRGGATALSMGGTVPYQSAAQYTMTVLPLFIIMGSFAFFAGFAQEGFNLARRWLEGITGGLVHATILGECAFAAASGSSIASVAVLTKVTIPEMIKHGVQKGLAIGVVAASATLDIMIPPSGTFVIYGLLTGQSIGKLLIAGVIPGLIGAALIMVTVYIRCKFDPSLVASTSTIHASWKERFLAIPRAWGVMFIGIVVLGGLYAGIFTPTEAGAIGAITAFLAMLITKKSKMHDLYESLLESAGVSSTVLIILIGGMMFSYMLAASRLPVMVSGYIVGLNVPPMVILIAIMVLYLILGCFVDTMAMLVITLPIVFPIILRLGFDPIWFGVLVVQTVEIALISPPYGMNLFVLKGMLPETTLGEIYRSVVWFIVPLVVTLAIYIAFPQVCLWLPNMMSR